MRLPVAIVIAHDFAVFIEELLSACNTIHFLIDLRSHNGVSDHVSVHLVYSFFFAPLEGQLLLFKFFECKLLLSSVFFFALLVGQLLLFNFCECLLLLSSAFFFSLSFVSKFFGFTDFFDRLFSLLG